MLSLPIQLTAYWAVFILALVRVSGIFLAAPFFSGPGTPVRMKIALTFFLTASIAPLLADQGAPALAWFLSPWSLAIAAAGELAIGFVLGLAGAAVVAAIQTAGHLISQDIGLTIANVIDPITSIQVSVITQIKLALALFIFVGLDMHHGVIRLVAESFQLIPLGGLASRFTSATGGRVLQDIAAGQGSMVFEAAVRLGLPVAATLLLVTVAMGFLARAVPEMNIFIIGFAIRALVGTWVLLMSLPLMARAFQALFEKAARDGAGALHAIWGGAG